MKLSLLSLAERLARCKEACAEALQAVRECQTSLSQMYKGFCMKESNEFFACFRRCRVSNAVCGNRDYMNQSMSNGPRDSQGSASWAWMLMLESISPQENHRRARRRQPRVMCAGEPVESSEGSSGCRSRCSSCTSDRSFFNDNVAPWTQL